MFCLFHQNRTWPWNITVNWFQSPLSYCIHMVASAIRHLGLFISLKPARPVSSRENITMVQHVHNSRLACRCRMQLKCPLCNTIRRTLLHNYAIMSAGRFCILCNPPPGRCCIMQLCPTGHICICSCVRPVQNRPCSKLNALGRRHTFAIFFKCMWNVRPFGIRCNYKIREYSCCTYMYMSAGRFLHSPGHICICKSVGSIERTVLHGGHRLLVRPVDTPFYTFCAWKTREMFCMILSYVVSLDGRALTNTLAVST